MLTHELVVVVALSCVGLDGGSAVVSVAGAAEAGREEMPISPASGDMCAFCMGLKVDGRPKLSTMSRIPELLT